MIVLASSHTGAAASLVDKIEEAILFPLITLLLAVALLMFLWGAFEYVYNADSDAGRDTGRRHMLWGVIGLLVMISALAILRIVASTFGVDV
jgi:hypothetical protein